MKYLQTFATGTLLTLATSCTPVVSQDHNQTFQESIIMSYIPGKEFGKVPIASHLYINSKKLNHKINTLDDYLKFVDYKDSIVQEMAKQFIKEQPNKELRAQKILDYIHQFSYDPRELKELFARHPIETIVEHIGNCGDLSILGASLMKAAGIDVALFIYPGSVEPGHGAIGVVGNFSGKSFPFENKNYFVAETTGTRTPTNPSTSKIGEVVVFRDKQPMIYPVR